VGWHERRLQGKMAREVALMRYRYSSSYGEELAFLLEHRLVGPAGATAPVMQALGVLAGAPHELRWPQNAPQAGEWFQGARAQAFLAL
jgi:hypothetical protein